MILTLDLTGLSYASFDKFRVDFSTYLDMRLDIMNFDIKEYWANVRDCETKRQMLEWHDGLKQLNNYVHCLKKISDNKLNLTQVSPGEMYSLKHYLTQYLSDLYRRLYQDKVEVTALYTKDDLMVTELIKQIKFVEDLNWKVTTEFKKI